MRNYFWPSIKVIIFEEYLLEYKLSRFNKSVGHQGRENKNCPHNLPLRSKKYLSDVKF